MIPSLSLCIELGPRMHAICGITSMHEPECDPIKDTSALRRYNHRHIRLLELLWGLTLTESNSKEMAHKRYVTKPTVVFARLARMKS
jgi:hypothetical protein